MGRSLLLRATLSITEPSRDCFARFLAVRSLGNGWSAPEAPSRFLLTAGRSNGSA
jgi:hypothetical protein